MADFRNTFRPERTGPIQQDGQIYTRYGRTQVIVVDPSDRDYEEVFEIAVNICEGCGALVSGLTHVHDDWHVQLETAAREASRASMHTAKLA